MGICDTNESDLYSSPQSNVLKENQEGFDVTKLFNPKGRMNRLGYLAYSFFVTFLTFGILAGIVAAFGKGEETLYFILGIYLGLVVAFGEGAGAETLTAIIFLAYIPIFSVTFIFTIRRFHDIDWSGWWVVATMLPLINLVFLLILLFKGGAADSNRFGNPPKRVGTLAAVFVILFIPIFILGIVAAIAVPVYQEYLNAAQEAQQHLQ